MSSYAVINSSDVVVSIAQPPSSTFATPFVNAGLWILLSNTSNVVVGDYYVGGSFSTPPATYGSAPVMSYMPVYANTVIDTSTVLVANGSSYIANNVFTVPPSCTTVILDVTPPVSNTLNTISFLALNQTTGSQRILFTGIGNTTTFHVVQSNTAVSGNTTIVVGQGYYSEVLYAPTANVIVIL